MQTVILPWGRWLDEEEKKIEFPDHWNLHVANRIMTVPGIGESGILEAFRAPVGSPRLAEIAMGRQDAVIAIDDITRPTPASRLLPFVIRELELGGLDRRNIRIIVASGAHRQTTMRELRIKIGEDIQNTVQVLHHVPYENLIDLGRSARGTPIITDRHYYDSDLKVVIGSIMPHPNAGFGGGRKIVSIGLSASSTLREFHKRDAGWLRTGYVDGNIQHEDLDEIMHAVGLDFAVEAVLTGTCGIADLFVGDPSDCFRLGVEKAWKLYATEAPSDADIAVLNAYPKDYDLIQACNTLWVAYFPSPNIVRPGGTIVCTAACPDGPGLHYLSTYGMPDPIRFEESNFHGRELIWYSNNLSQFDIGPYFPESVRVYQHWDQVVTRLQEKHPAPVNVTVIPCAPLHLSPSLRHASPIRI